MRSLRSSPTATALPCYPTVAWRRRGPRRRARTGLAGRAPVERDAVELLRCVGEGVGLLRAGLTYATWCQQVASTG
jgi:hypothetical protein